jgi:hypothetical protein
MLGGHWHAHANSRGHGTGPLGDRRFAERVSAAVGRDLVPKKPGRKPKKE